MAVTVKLDLPGSTFVNEFLPGGSYQRRARVDGLTQTDPLDLIFEALSALPQPNEALPAPFVGLYLTRQVLTALGCTGTNKWATVDLIYEGRDDAYMAAGGGIPNNNGPTVKISSGSSVFQQDTDVDRTGTQITTTFDNVTQAHRVLTFGVTSSPTFRRLEADDPQTRADTYVGRVNSLPFLGKPTRSVFCSSILGESRDAGGTYEVTYRFEIRNNYGWDPVVVHDDPFFPGNPLPGASGAARFVYETLNEADFNLLNLV